MSVCALKGSSVDLRCPIPSLTQVTEMVWYNEWSNGKTYDLRRDPNYEGRVEYHGTTEKDCILRITDLRQRDITTYYFRYKTNQYSEWKYSYGFPLSLTDLKVERIYDNKLTCKTTCTLTGNPTYIWYKNGQHLDESTSPQYKDPVSSNYVDSFSCAVKGHEDLRSPAVCAQGHNCWRVTYTKRRICVLKGSKVDISCSYTHPTSYIEQGSFWFTQKHPVDLSSYPEYAGRVEYNRNTENHHTMTITHLTEKDSAEYKFRLTTTDEGRFSGLPGVMLTVTGNNILLEMDPTSVSEGERVTLRCRTKCTVGLNPNYIWYKNGQYIEQRTSSMYSKYVYSEDEGSYSCAVKGHEDLHSPAVYGPRNTSVSVSPSGEIVEGSSVTLTCSSDANPPVDKYTWYKKNVASPKASGQSYSITNIISEDRGEYYCEAQNGRGSMNSTALMIIVAGKQTSVVTAAVGIIVVVLVLILCLSGLMWSRKKVSTSTSNTRDTAEDGQGDSSPVYDNISVMAMTPTAAQTAATDDQDDVHYASVYFSRSKNQEVPLYSTVQLNQPQKHDQDVQYAAVKFNLPSSATQPAAAQAAEVDPSEIYSTVNKPRTKKT
ncbi:nectin-4-like [Salvelinus fontinalis]|uniref:nectin-4-like n=1 Tax=Salvelinus fontinalis TaxID=8038 RepID=UPI0024852665|nr:nectin-4-like [Salvelinus fontinalis]